MDVSVEQVTTSDLQQPQVSEPAPAREAAEANTFNDVGV